MTPRSCGCSSGRCGQRATRPPRPADGGGALARAESWAPDAIVLDVMMPGVDGLGVARRLRDKGSAVPILLLTARDAVADRVAGLDSGADDYLVKPFAADELTARLRALLRRGPGRGDRLLRRPVDRSRDPRCSPRRHRARADRARGRPAAPAAPQRRPGGQPRRRRCARSGAPAGCRPPTPSTATSPTCGRSWAPPRDPHRARRWLPAAAMRNWKLRTRVALAAASAIFLAVALVGVAIQLLLARDLHRQLDSTLRQRATDVATLSASAPAAADDARRARFGAGDRRSWTSRWSIATGGSSPARSRSVPAFCPPNSSSIGQSARAWRATPTRPWAGERLRVYAAPLADVGGGPAAGGAVVVASTTDEVDGTLDRLRQLTLFAAPGGGRGGGAAGRWPSPAAPCARWSELTSDAARDRPHRRPVAAPADGRRRGRGAAS